MKASCWSPGLDDVSGDTGSLLSALPESNVTLRPCMGPFLCCASISPFLPQGAAFGPKTSEGVLRLGVWVSNEPVFTGPRYRRFKACHEFNNRMLGRRGLFQAVYIV